MFLSSFTDHQFALGLDIILSSVRTYTSTTTAAPDETCGEKRDSWLTNGSEKGAFKR